MLLIQVASAHSLGVIVFKKHLVFMGLALSVGGSSVPVASADDAAGVTTVSPQYRSRTPLERIFGNFAGWSTRRQPTTVATLQPAVANDAATQAAPAGATAAEESTAGQENLPEQTEADAENSPVQVQPAKPAATKVAEEDNENAATQSDDIYEESDAEVDIYAPQKGGKRKRFKPKRHAGDTDVILLASARPLEEGQVNISLDELLLWRAQLGVTDDFTLEANSLWGFSIGINGKYALMRERNTAVAVQFGAGAFTVEKRMNWSYASLLYAKDMGRGAVHAGGHLIFAHTPDGKSYVVPQATAGAEVTLMKRVRALTELGFGNDILQSTGVENNTGFLNLGLRLDLSPVYATGGLVIPMNEPFLDSPALGIPFLRIGATF
jgi:hypothetical protein